VSGRHIYVVGVHENPVKIGIADNVETRVAGLQVGRPDPLVIFARLLVPTRCATKIERDCHVELSAHHRRGEWFNVHWSEAVKTVEQVAARVKAADRPRLSKDTEDLIRLIERKKVGPWANSAVMHYKSCLRGAGKRGALAEMENVIVQASGLEGLSIFRIVMVDKRPLRLVFFGEPQLVQKAEDLLVSAINALTKWHRSVREEYLLDKIQGNAA
jgi:hypothetical protein